MTSSGSAKLDDQLNPMCRHASGQSSRYLAMPGWNAITAQAAPHVQLPSRPPHAPSDPTVQCAFSLRTLLRICPKFGRLRDELLNETLLRSLWQAQRLIAEWQTDYNEKRPHTSLGGLTPNEFATRFTMDQNPNSDSGHRRGRVIFAGPAGAIFDSLLEY